jgi:hypothetical protein
MTEALHLGTGPFDVSAGTSLPTTYPTGYVAVAGDVAYLNLQQVAGNGAVTTPTGYTLLLRTQRTTTHVMHTYRRVLANGDAAPTVTIPAAQTAASTLSIWRNLSATPEDVAIVAATDTASSFTGPDVGDTVTPAAPIMTLVSAKNAPTGGVLLQDDSTISPFKMFEGSNYISVGASTAGVFHPNMLTTQTDANRTHDFGFFGSFTAGGGWIGHAIALRPSDPAAVPVARDLRASMRQQTMRSFGQRCAQLDTTYQVKFSVQVLNTVDAGGGTWSSGADGDFWNLGAWGGPGRWQDMTSRIRGVTWTQGADQPGDRPRVGTATIDLENAAGDLSPWATTGGFLENGVSWFRAGAIMRIANTYLDATGDQQSHTNFTGRIEAVEDHNAEGVDAWVTVHLVELIADLAAFNGLEQTEVGAGETANTRVVRLLADAGWPFGYWIGSIPGTWSSATLQATTLAGNRIEELYKTGDSVGTYIYSYPDGGILVNNPDAAGGTAITFSNNPAGAERPIPVDGYTPYADKSRLLNTAIGAIVGGTEQSISDALSVSKFGRIDSGNGWPRRDLICQSEATVATILQAVIDMHAWDDKGISAVEVDCDLQPATLYSNISFLQVFHNATARVQHPSGQIETQVGYVEGFTHRVTNPGGGQLKWTATISLAAYPT